MKISDYIDPIESAAPGMLIGNWNGFRLSTVPIGLDRVALQLRDEITGIKYNCHSVKIGKTLTEEHMNAWGNKEGRIVDTVLHSGACKIMNLRVGRNGIQFDECWPSGVLNRSLPLESFIHYSRMKAQAPSVWFGDKRTVLRNTSLVANSLQEAKDSFTTLLTETIQSLTDHFFIDMDGATATVWIDEFNMDVRTKKFYNATESCHYYVIGRIMEMHRLLTTKLDSIELLLKNQSFHALPADQPDVDVAALMTDLETSEHTRYFGDSVLRRVIYKEGDTYTVKLIGLEAMFVEFRGKKLEFI